MSVDDEAAVGASPLNQEGGKLAVRVGPALAHSMTTITKAELSLAVAVGELEDEQSVIVPFLDCALYDSPDGGEPAWVGRLAMDNVAFLLEQVAAGLLEALDPLANMTKGDLKPPLGRMEYAADRVASASESLRDAAARLRAVAALRI